MNREGFDHLLLMFGSKARCSNIGDESRWVERRGKAEGINKAPDNRHQINMAIDFYQEAQTDTHLRSLTTSHQVRIEYS